MQWNIQMAQQFKAQKALEEFCFISFVFHISRSSWVFCDREIPAHGSKPILWLYLSYSFSCSVERCILSSICHQTMTSASTSFIRFGSRAFCHPSPMPSQTLQTIVSNLNMFIARELTGHDHGRSVATVLSVSKVWPYSGMARIQRLIALKDRKLSFTNVKLQSRYSLLVRVSDLDNLHLLQYQIWRLLRSNPPNHQYFLHQSRFLSGAFHKFVIFSRAPAIHGTRSW